MSKSNYQLVLVQEFTVHEINYQIIGYTTNCSYKSRNQVILGETLGKINSFNNSFYMSNFNNSTFEYLSSQLSYTNSI